MAWTTVVTNEGARLLRSRSFGQADSPSTAYELRLFTDAVIPTVDTDDVGGLTEVSTGSTTGYAPINLVNNSTNFPVTKSDASDWAQFTIPDQQIVGGTGGFTFRTAGLVAVASSALEQFWTEDTTNITVNPLQPLDLTDLIGRSDTVP